MRTWDDMDIVDVLTKHYYELRDASAELAEGGDHQGSDEIDDSCIAIEIFLEQERGVVWDGVQFTYSTKNDPRLPQSLECQWKSQPKN